MTLRKGLSKVTFSVRGGRAPPSSLPCVLLCLSQPATLIHAEGGWLTRDPSAQFLPLLKPSQASSLCIPLPPGPKDMLQLDVTEHKTLKTQMRSGMLQPLRNRSWTEGCQQVLDTSMFVLKTVSEASTEPPQVLPSEPWGSACDNNRPPLNYGPPSISSCQLPAM